MTALMAVPTFVCPLSNCEATYTDSRSFADHVNSHHSAYLAACPTCGRTFTSRGALGSHQRTHANDTPLELVRQQRPIERAPRQPRIRNRYRLVLASSLNRGDEIRSERDKAVTVTDISWHEPGDRYPVEIEITLDKRTFRCVPTTRFVRITRGGK